MNFQNMPGQTDSGFYAIIGAMTVIALGMLVFFRRRKWL